MLHNDLQRLHQFRNEVEVDGDVTRHLTVTVIIDNSDGRQVMVAEDRWLQLLTTHLTYDRPSPRNLLGGHRLIFTARQKGSRSLAGMLCTPRGQCQKSW